MKKRILCIVTAFAVCLTLLPVQMQALALDDELAPDENSATVQAEVQYRTKAEGEGWSNWKESGLMNAAFSTDYCQADYVEIELLRDIETSNGWYGFTIAMKTGQQITVDGKGHTIKRTVNTTLFTVGSDDNPVERAKVILKNITLDGGADWTGDKQDPAKRTNSGLSATVYLIDLCASSTLVLDSGAKIQNCASVSSKSDGSVILAHGSGTTLEMKDGAIVRDNSIKSEGRNGGAFCIHSGAKLTMSGGEISGNYANTAGGAVVTYGEFEMSDGKISGNVSGNNGGGVCINKTSGGKGIFTMSGGTISGNSSPAGGGVTVLTSSSSFIMSGGTISDNTSESSGGGMYIGGIFTMSGGKISGNTSGSNGGGMYIGGTGSFTMSGGEITGNKAKSSGGGAVFTTGMFDMSGGKISGNSSGNNGGGVTISASSSSSGNFTMSGGEISNNSTYAGGGVSVLGGSSAFTMSGGKITGNIITGNLGGGVLLNKGTMFVSGTPVINGNTGSNGGNNLYLPSAKTIYVSYALNADANIGVTSAASNLPIDVTNANSADYSSYFYSDNQKYSIQNGSSNTVQLSDTIPAKPRNLTAVPGVESVTISWEAPAMTGGDGYTIKRYEVTCDGQKWENVDANTTKYTFNDLTPDQKYTFQVHVVTSDGSSSEKTSGSAQKTATPSASTYKVTLNVDGGTIKSGNITSYPTGVGADLPSDVTKDGYDFGGWYENSDFSGDAVTSIGKNETGDKTFYAKWISIYTVSVTASPDEGGTVTGGGTYHDGDSVEVTAEPNSGYRFVKWTEDNADTAVSTNTSYTFKVDKTRALTAVFEKTVTNITLNKTSVSLNKGETAELSAAVEPTDAADKSVTWSSSDESVATVDENGHVTAINGGEAVITVSSKDGGNVSATCNVTVIVKHAVTGVRLDNNSLSKTKGEIVTLTATVEPSDASNTDVTWTSNNPDVASVSKETITAEGSETATITAKDVGTATITVTAHNGKSASCTVTVSAKTYTVSYNANSGGGTMGNSTATDGEAFVLPGCRFTPPENKVFDTWAIGSANGAKAKAGESRTFTGATTLYAIWKDAPRVRYTVKYNANGGSGAMDSGIAPDKEAFALPECGFASPANMEFDCWTIGSPDGPHIKPGGSYTFTADTTVYANWKERPYEITGTVTLEGGGTVSGVSVQLRKGSTVIAEQSTGTDGKFTFNGITRGTYNLVAEKDGIIQTAIQKIDKSSADLTIIFPKKGISSVVNIVKNDDDGNETATPDVVVGGLDKEAVKYVEEHFKDEAEVEKVQKVTVTMNVEKKPEAEAKGAEKIKEEVAKQQPTTAKDTKLEYLDVSVNAVITKADAPNTTENVTETKTVMELVVPFDFKGKQDVKVYRYHVTKDGQKEVKTLGVATDTSTDGTYMADVINGLIHIYTQKFSTYAIGYTDSEPDNTDRPSGGSGSGSSRYPISTAAKLENGAVAIDKKNASKGSTVSITVTPVEGYVLETLTVTDAKNNKLKLTDKGNGKYTFIMPDSKVNVDAQFVKADNKPEKPATEVTTKDFSDLTDNAWYHEAVEYVLSEGVMNGYGDGIFGPDENLSRAELAQILYNREGRPESTGTSIFNDVSSGKWYTNAIIWANQKGVVGGYGNGLFGPDDPITREQLAVMLWRYAGNPPTANKKLDFTDADETGSFALEAMSWAVENGIITGYGDERINPKGLATRAQAAQMLMRYLKGMEEK